MVSLNQRAVLVALHTCEHESEALRSGLSEQRGFGQVMDLALSVAETYRDAVSACRSRTLGGEANARGRPGNHPSWGSMHAAGVIGA